MEVTFLRAILNKTKKVRILNTGISLEPGVDEIKNDIQMSRLWWFEHVLQVGAERVPKKILHSKMEKNEQDDPELHSVPGDLVHEGVACYWVRTVLTNHV